MSLLNDVFNEFFNKKGIVAALSGGAGAFVYGTTVEKKKTILVFTLLIVTGGLTATFCTPSAVEAIKWAFLKYGVSVTVTSEEERFISFTIGLTSIAIIPNIISGLKKLRIRFKLPKIVSSVAEDAKDE